MRQLSCVDVWGDERHDHDRPLLRGVSIRLGVVANDQAASLFPVRLTDLAGIVLEGSEDRVLVLAYVMNERRLESRDCFHMSTEVKDVDARDAVGRLASLWKTEKYLIELIQRRIQLRQS